MTVKTIDLVKQLQNVLPNYTDDFSMKEDITSCESGTGELIIKPIIEGMEVGSYINLKGLKTKTTISSFDTSDGLTTVRTLKKLDYTQGYTKKSFILVGTELKEYEVVEVRGNMEFVIKNPNADDLTGGSVIQSIAGLNKQYKIKSIDEADGSFKVDSNQRTPDGFYTEEAEIVHGYNIFGIGFAENINKYIDSSTDEDGGAKTTAVKTLFVRAEQERTSVNRNTLDDAISSTPENQSTELLNVKSFEIVLTYPANQDTTGFEGVCYAEELQTILYKCLYGLKLSGNSTVEGDYLLTPTGNNPVEYNSAIYQHSYTFEICYKTSNDSESSDGVDNETVSADFIVMNYKLKEDGYEKIKKTDVVGLKS